MLQQKWSTKLLGYDYEIRYRSGQENKIAYALYRPHDDDDTTQLCAITVVKPQWF